MSIAGARGTFNRPYKNRTYRGKLYNFDKDQISAGRMAERGWPWIARHYGCDHTTVMHAAVRLGCYLGKGWTAVHRKAREKKPIQLPEPLGEWPAGIRVEDDPRLTRRAA